MKIVELRTEGEFEGLRETWNGMLEQSASNTIFLTWEWVSAWWAAYGRPGDLRVLLAFEGDGRLRGIAPLRRTTARRYGRAYPVLAFIGDGSADSDYLDFIIAAGAERQVMTAFRSHLDAEFGTGTLLQLNEVPDSSPNLGILREMGAENGMVWTEADSPCAKVTLPADWESYLKELAPRFRTKIRSVLRNLTGRPDVRFHFCERAGELEGLLGSLFDLHRKRWAKDAKPGVFQTNEKRDFYARLSALLLDRGWLSFSALEWKGRVLASQYGFTYRNQYFQLQEGYDPDCEHWNVGIALRAWSIQELLQKSVREYDFLGGVGRPKSDWGAQTQLSKRLLLGRRTVANALYCRGPEWIVQSRQIIKQRVPQRWIAARDARQEQERKAAFEQQRARLLDRVWVRRSLARVYHYSALPLLLSPLRKHYQLRISPAGNVPRLQLRKRQNPSVRILYYHRVNDEGDPFFPALPTAQFEEEIAMIARHYRFVSLKEAVRRLVEGGPPEPVLVVTFDDGYEDNYRVAMPILERYGVPATIFLTTGSIDSGQPLWFDRLSVAVKKSPHAFVELELDTPRRFPLRGEQERLNAKDQIYAFLRSLTDADRRRRVTEIVARLGGNAEEGLRDQMLTWDQVRSLQARGVAFGGHTVTHPFVSRLLPDQAAWEIGECKRRIEEELQAPVEHFAYPSGREIDFSQWNKRVVQEAGYQAAVSTLWGVNHPATDRMELRRGRIWETERAVFAAKLDWYQWVDG